jgi:hypothetical protein
MTTFGATLRAGLHWLTAAMTLLAGVPAFQCRCEGGPAAKSRSTVITKQVTCCCGGQCCASTPGSVAGHACEAPAPQKAEAGTCCQHHGGRPAEPTHGAGDARTKTCTQGVVHPDEFLSDGGVSPVVVSGSLCQLLPPPQPVNSPELSLSAAGPDWFAHPTAPPAKLRALLQRFLI